MKATVSNGLTIDRYIPPQLRNTFYKNTNRRYMRNNGLDPYGFSTEGLVLYLPLWALKESSFKLVDAYQHTATVTGALWKPDGRLFDSDDKIECGNNSVLDFTTGNFSILIWLYPTSLPAVARIIRRATFNSKGWAVYLTSANAKIELATLDGDAVSLNAYNSIDLNMWQHFAIVRTGTTTGLIYKSAVDVTTTGVTQDIVTTTDTLTLGTDGTWPFFGTIGEAWIYNRALSPLEIQHNYLATKWRYQ